MHCKTVTILLRIRVRGHFVKSFTNNHESHYMSQYWTTPHEIEEQTYTIDWWVWDSCERKSLFVFSVGKVVNWKMSPFWRTTFTGRRSLLLPLSYNLQVTKLSESYPSYPRDPTLFHLPTLVFFLWKKKAFRILKQVSWVFVIYLSFSKQQRCITPYWCILHFLWSHCVFTLFSYLHNIFQRKRKL